MSPHSLPIAERLSALGALLNASAALWRPAPFHYAVQPWAGDYPVLFEAIAKLSAGQVEAFHADEPALRGWLQGFIPGMGDLNALVDVPRWSAAPMPRSGLHAPERDVPGRKWAQIEALGGLALAQLDQAGEVLDWCAGKAHLGRLIGLHSGLPVRSLERDAALCAQAERLAARDGIALTAEVCDVLALPPGHVLAPGTLACALHACGDLHLTLLDQAQSASPAGLLIAPCCYHRTSRAIYRARSSVGRACGLALGREDLRVAVLETATAGHAQREADKRRKARLLALQHWGAQHGRALQDYARLRDLARGEYGAALRRACERLAWPLPDADALVELLAHGERRAAEVRAFELIRAAIRRPLELWLVLDMALGLEEAGFAVEVGEFCAGAITPRNLLIRARRAQP
ncbi:MAG: methyltransferase [Pseudomonadota bacterium]